MMPMAGIVGRTGTLDADLIYSNGFGDYGLTTLTAILSTYGAQVGDLAIVVDGSTPTSPGGTWSSVSGAPVSIYRRRLSAADIAGKITLQDRSNLLILRKAASLALVRSGGYAGTSTLSGVTRAANSAGFLSVGYDSDAGHGGLPTPATVTGPGVWPVLISGASNDNPDRDNASAVSVQVRLAASNAAPLPNATAFNVTGNSGGYNTIAIFELRND